MCCPEVRSRFSHPLAPILTLFSSILDSCKGTIQGQINACATTDYSCLCTQYINMLTCYNNCPMDTSVAIVQQQRELYCNDASVYGTTTTLGTAPATTMSTSATTTGSETAAQSGFSSGTGTGSSTHASSTSSSGADIKSAGGLFAIIAAGVVALL